MVMGSWTTLPLSPYHNTRYIIPPPIRPVPHRSRTLGRNPCRRRRKALSRDGRERSTSRSSSPRATSRPQAVSMGENAHMQRSPCPFDMDCPFFWSGDDDELIEHAKMNHRTVSYIRTFDIFAGIKSSTILYNLIILVAKKGYQIM